MKTWKRNAIVASVLVLICAGVYLNWTANQGKPVDFTETLNADQVMNDATLTMGSTAQDQAAEPASVNVADYFAQIRLSRQESRDSAVELLQETLAYEDGSESGTAAANTLDAIVSDALAESQIESLVIAKGFADCVAYMNDEGISVAVSAPAEGLASADVAMISDIVTTQTDYDLSQIRVIEVK